MSVPLLIIAFACVTVNSLPDLVFPGFAWAENLEFDGLGNLFVSEAVRGELWRIRPNSNQTDYEGKILLDDGFKMFGGLAATPDGSHLYAGATFSDETHSILMISTLCEVGEYQVVAKTSHHPNGMACDWENKLCYYTDEGTGEDNGGTLNMVNISSGVETLVKDNVAYPDGLWFDKSSHFLYVGELVTKKIDVFSTSASGAVFHGQYTGLHEALNVVNIIDDITIFSTCASGDPSCSKLLAADWTGKSLQLFSVDGTEVQSIPPPADIKFKELTSVKWGRGPGFDEESVYVTEGGGVVGKETNRRVIQVKFAPQHGH